ncbi:MAG: hypothetical protein A2033_13365 [Bacteroidetes bacterium GWA2_31_9]|nr:MAG: hypothetical protein A2033_13365 [Bacteroidetes bacterium GWA2_31_9]
MIYAYKYLSHKIEKFHENIAYFFEQMFKHDLAVYNDDVLFKADFKIIINDSNKLVGNFKEITEKYHKLSNADKKTIQDAYKNNCEIEHLCNNTGAYKPVKYTEISDTAFRKVLKDFLTELWDEYYFVNSIKDNFGTIQEHFTAFKKHQTAKVCPFCGLLPLKPSTSIHRNAYDHYIPKSLYPFVSVNFKNLFPMCNECNSDEKKQTDTPYNNNLCRRKVFYPFDTFYDSSKLEISITANHVFKFKNINQVLEENDWDLAILLAGIEDPRLVSWDEIFCIKRRYKENLIDYQITWFDDFVVKRYIENTKDGLHYNRFKDILLDEAKSQIKDNPLSVLRYVYFNFLFSLPDFETRLIETINVK